MEDFKIKIFRNEYNFDFPLYKSLSEGESSALIKNIAEKYNVTETDIEKELALKQSFYEDSNALEEFELTNMLFKIGVKPRSHILVNWYQFKKVDEYNIDDFDKYFYDIWFPIADDIDIFDESLNWILSIRHDGCISFIEFLR